jgi:hypothetical protein
LRIDTDCFYYPLEQELAKRVGREYGLVSSKVVVDQFMDMIDGDCFVWKGRRVLLRRYLREDFSYHMYPNNYKNNNQTILNT